MAEKIQKNVARPSTSRQPTSAPGAATSTSPTPPKKSFSWSTFILMFLGIMAIWLMFDTQLRMDFAAAFGAVLTPLFGFNNAYPIWTLFFAGLIMTIFSTAVRHYYIDWIEMAKFQKIQSAFNKERMAAYRSGNTGKVQKMQQENMKIMEMSAKNMKSNFKTMALTMFLIIVMFAWLWLFLSKVDNQAFAVPWATDIKYTDNPLLLPNWILMYSLVSLPAGQVLGRVLKHYSFSKKLAVLESNKKKDHSIEDAKTIDSEESTDEESQEDDGKEKNLSSLQDELDGGGHDHINRRTPGER